MKISNLILLSVFILSSGISAWGFPYNLPACLIGGIMGGMLLAKDTRY